MTRGVTVILMFVCTLLAGLLVWLWVGPNGALRGIQWQAPAAVRPDLGGLSAASIKKEDADINRFMAILDRPVFSPSRRPPPPPPPPKVVAPVRPDPLDTIHLYGLFSGAGGGGVIVRVEGKTRRVKISESIGDWSLKEIRPRDVVFAKGGENRVVPLMQSTQAAGAAAPRPAFSAPVFPGAAAVPAPAPAAAGSAGPGPPQAAQQPAGSAAAKPGAAAPASPFVIGGSR